MLRPIEKLIYRIAGVDETREMRWTEYGVAMLVFSGVSMLLLYLIERVQTVAAAQSAEIRKLGAVSGVEYRRVVYHEY